MLPSARAKRAGLLRTNLRAGFLNKTNLQKSETDSDSTVIVAIPLPSASRLENSAIHGKSAQMSNACRVFGKEKNSRLWVNTDISLPPFFKTTSFELSFSSFFHP